MRAIIFEEYATILKKFCEAYRLKETPRDREAAQENRFEAITGFSKFEFEYRL